MPRIRAKRPVTAPARRKFCVTLPAALIKRAKMQALQDNQEPRQLVEDALRRYLAEAARTRPQADDDGLRAVG